MTKFNIHHPGPLRDWAKIAKSSRPVDVRIKELNNTAVPLPFKFFATMNMTHPLVFLWSFFRLLRSKDSKGEGRREVEYTMKVAKQVQPKVYGT